MSVSQSLSVTEVGVNTSANTSQVHILWTSTQSGESWNGYTRTAKYYISVNGADEIEQSVTYTLPQNTTKTILDTTVTVAHKTDGSGTVRVRTWMDTGISAEIVEKSQALTLTTIPRASTITSAYSVTLGSRCKIAWTPASKTFYYKVKFELGSWNYTTVAFCPGTASSYTYTGYPVPMAVASNFPNAKSGTMTATLYTYSDSEGTKQVGSASSKTFAVTLPDNESTKPAIAMSLSPDTPYTDFASLYLQGRSKVKATFSGEGKYGATIASYRLKVEGKQYSSPYLSNILSRSGTITVVGIVTDSRGFSNTVEQEIDVIPYSKPKILPASDESEIICARCDGDGNLSESGTYLKIKARRSYYKVTADGEQNNFCAIRYRYRKETSNTFSSWVTILAGSKTSTNTIDSDPISGVVSSTTTSYVVQVGVIDDVGHTATVQFIIPTDFITVDIPESKKGKRIGIGRYAENSNEPGIDIGMDMYFDDGTTIHGAFADTVAETGLYTHEASDSVVSGSWRYRKWESGTYDISGLFYIQPTESHTFSSGVGYYSNQIQIKLPFDIESVQFTGTPTEQYYWLVNAALAVADENIIGFRLVRFIAIDTANSVPVRLIGHGRWK